MIFKRNIQLSWYSISRELFVSSLGMTYQESSSKPRFVTTSQRSRQWQTVFCVHNLYPGKVCYDSDTMLFGADFLIVRFLVLYNTLRKLVNCIWDLDHFEHAKLAKYMRCLLKATLPLEPEVPLRVIEETCNMVKQTVEVSHS